MSANVCFIFHFLVHYLVVLSIISLSYLVFKIHFFLFKIGIADYEKDVWKVNKKTEKEIPHDGEIKEVKEMSIEDCWLNGRFV